MPETNGIKPGDTKTYEINGEKLTMGALPMGRLKKLWKVFFTAIDDVSDSVEGTNLDVLKRMPDLFDKNVTEIIPILFDPETHDFLNADWIDKNITLPHLEEIYQDVYSINGLKSFFGNRGSKKAPLAPQNGKNPIQLNQTR